MPQESQLLVDAELLSACSYIDTVTIQSTSPFPSEAIRFFKKYSNPYGPIEKPWYDDKVLWQYPLHQPQPEIFDYLTEKKSNIIFVAIALDLLTSDAHKAAELQKAFVQHLMPHERPAETVHWIGSTAYFGFQRAKRFSGLSVAVYSDRPSKTAEFSSCCHIEWRIRGAKKLRELGMREPEHLLFFNHTEFWRAILRLVELPSLEKIGSSYMKAHALGKHGGSRQFPYGGRTKGAERVGSHFLRPVYGNDTEPTSANDLAFHLSKRKKAFSGINVSSVFSATDIEPWLPPPHNALWVDGR